MKQTALVMFLCLLSCDFGHAMEAALWRGLQLQHEALPEGTRFNGFPLQAVRFTGRDIAILEQRWLDEHGPGNVRSQRAAGWQIHSRLRGGRSEVLQVREGPAGGEAIWSMLPLAHGSVGISSVLGRLPAACDEGPVVEGRERGEHYRQQTATCRTPVAETLRRVESLARSRELQINGRWQGGFEAGRRDASGLVMVLAQAGADGGSQLVVLERAAGAGVLR